MFVCVVGFGSVGVFRGQCVFVFGWVWDGCLFLGGSVCLCVFGFGEVAVVVFGRVRVFGVGEVGVVVFGRLYKFGNVGVLGGGQHVYVFGF